MKFYLLLWQKPCTNFTTTYFIPRSSSNSCPSSCRFSFITAYTWSTFFYVFCLLKVFQNVDNFQQIPSHLSSVTTRILLVHHSKSILNHSESSLGQKLKFYTNCNITSLIWFLKHFEWWVAETTLFLFLHSFLIHARLQMNGIPLDATIC